MNYLLIPLILYMFSTTSYAQSFENLKWKNRIILIEADRLSNPELKKQVALLEKHRTKWGDYQLVIIEQTNDEIRENISKITSRDKKQFYKGFKVYLVGLDGGVKFQSEEAQDAQVFFDLISAMPLYRK